MEEFWFFAIGMALFVGLLGIFKLCTDYKELKRQAQKEIEKRIKYKDIMPLKYLFPVEEFCKLCKKSKWTDVDNDIHVRKMVNIAKELIKADQKYSPYIYEGEDLLNIFRIYASENQVKKFLTDFQKQKLINEEKRKAEIRERELHPQRVTLEFKENSFREFSKNCKNYKYLNKRQEYLKYLISTAEEELKYAEMDYKHARKYSTSTFYSTKGKDWAIAGGIANAIAGPAAGIMVASQTIAENESNKDINKLIMNSAYSKESDAFSTVSKIKKIIEEYKKELNSLYEKIVFEEISSETLCDNLLIKARLNKTQHNILELSIKNKYPQNPDLETVIDGTVQVKVLCDGNLVEEVCVALPCYGVPCNNKTTIASTFLQYEMVPGKTNYSFEIKPNFMWLMEA